MDHQIYSARLHSPLAKEMLSWANQNVSSTSVTINEDWLSISVERNKVFEFERAITSRMSRPHTSEKPSLLTRLIDFIRSI